MQEPTEANLSAALDRSARGPVLLLLLGGLCWLAIAAVLGLIGALKLQAPQFLSACPLLTTGRVWGAGTHAFLYGFASQAGLAVTLWLLCRFGRTPLQAGWMAGLGGLTWNLAVLVGLAGILAGGSTGYEWLEMPQTAASIMLLGYLGLAISALLTLHERSVRELYVSQWYLLAAVLWFAWIFSSTYLLLLENPVRGLVQETVNVWYQVNFINLWLTPMALAAVFYLVPKLTRQPLHNRNLALFGFWTLALFGSWGGLTPGVPLPAWLTGLSNCAATLMVIPVIAVLTNLWQTARGHLDEVTRDARLRFVAVGLVSYALATALNLLLTLQNVSWLTEFTWLSKLPGMLNLHGFVAMSLFAAIYHLTPQLAQRDWPWPKLVSFHFWAATTALVLQTVSLSIAGLRQGAVLSDPTRPFAESLGQAVPWLTLNSLGQLFWLLGGLALLVNVCSLVGTVCCRCCASDSKQPTPKATLAEVLP